MSLVSDAARAAAEGSAAGLAVSLFIVDPRSSRTPQWFADTKIPSGATMRLKGLGSGEWS